MAWYNDGAPRHEGYLIGIRSGTNKRGSIVFRELGIDDDEGRDVGLRAVQVGCSCGWRSQRLRAPYGTTWNQMVQLPRHECEMYETSHALERKPFETSCRELWREHALSATQADLEIMEE